MHEVVRRLKKIIPQNNDDIFNQITNKDPALNSIEALSHGELSQMINNFHNINTNEIESSTTSTNEKMINKSISSKNLSQVVNEIVAFITKVINKGVEQKLIK